MNKEINETKLVGKIPANGSFSSASSSAGYIYHRKKDYKDFISSSTTSSSIPIPTSNTAPSNISNHKNFASTSSTIPLSTSTYSSNKYINSSSYNVTPDILSFGNNYSSQSSTNAYTPRHTTKFPFTPTMKPYETPLQPQHHQTPHVSWTSSNNNISGVTNNDSRLNSTDGIAKDENS